ncbi:uncharacterized protein LOC129291651 [Prosopis cineraria]|uniref:uncharacterized protein LOC129291651 n=1 Tax=Prosopis cineraria TaxID=364024 RepID=UPI002410696D|nr:uncharacterized protein LOC129291651 [Prosopis cineraria]
MEGLIPFVYRAFVQYKNEKEGPLGSLFSESPSYSYMRLPAGDSGRFQPSASAFLSDYGFTSASSSSSKSAASAAQVLTSSGVQSPRRRLTPRRASATKSVMDSDDL